MRNLSLVLLFPLMLLSSMASFSAQANLPASLLGDTATQQPQFLPVEDAFRFDGQQDGQTLRLYWQIADGYYLYRQQFAFTSSTADTPLAPISFPSGESYTDDYFGTSEIYKYNLSLDVPLDAVSESGTVTVRYQGCASAGLCYPPVEKVLTVSVAGDPGAGTAPQAPETSFFDQDNLWLTLGLFFALGLGLAFTPCVFPMYPILSGVIAGQSNLTSRRAFALSLSYVQGMALTYTLLGVVVASAGVKFQAALQHPVILGGISLLFVVLALSMFGLYELRLPSSWQQKLDSASRAQRRGKLTGAFTMGAISGLVASPCTSAPLSGALLYIAQSGDLALGAGALYSLSLGMGIPLLLLGTSAGNLLPRAGAWMNQVKTLFGFGLLAVSVLFIERFTPATLSLALWSALLLAVAIYLLLLNRNSKGWKFALSGALLAVSLIASGDFARQAYAHWQLGDELPDHALAFNRVSTISELEAELAMARANNQPVMLDFYADWCIACKDFEETTFRDGEVQRQLDNTRLLQADVTRTTPEAIELLERLDILGLPTLVFYGSDGKEQRTMRVTGFMPPAQFAEHLSQR